MSSKGTKGRTFPTRLPRAELRGPGVSSLLHGETQPLRLFQVKLPRATAMVYFAHNGDSCKLF